MPAENEAKLRFVFFIVVIISFGQLTAQQHCGVAGLYEATFDQSIQSRTNQNSIWVVFHVLYRDTIQNISEEQILSQIEVLNQDFNKNNANRSKIPEIFKSLEADIGLRFCLAQTDPAGNPTTGIQRRQTEIERIGERIGSGGRKVVKHDGLGGLDAWDPTRYLNVWICEHAVFGEATFPDEGREDEQGIIVDYRAVGGIPDTYKYEDTQRGHVLTHEIGHYLGLNHLWGTEAASCESDDGIEDTPLQRAANYGCPETIPESCGSPDMIHNFMDFSNDECLAFFTSDQKAFMLSVLQEKRPLLAHSSCLVSNEEVQTSILIYPTLVEDELRILTNRPISAVRLYNVAGQLVLHKAVSTNTELVLNLSRFSTGIYFVQVIESRSIMAVGKVLKH